MPKQLNSKTTVFLTGVLLVGALAALPAKAGSDTPPRVDSSVPNLQPPYPDAAQVSGEQGTVIVDVLVRSSGRPTRAKVSQSSGFDDLDTAAVQGVLNWHFIPATRDGDTVSDWTTVKVVYHLPTLVPASMEPRKS
jgi:protein TonB